MNKKRLLCVTLTAVLLVSSTAIVAFADQTSAMATKNVIKVTSDGNKVFQKDTDSKSRYIIIDDSAGVKFTSTANGNNPLASLNDQLQKMENGTIKSTPADIQSLKTLISDIKSGKVQSKVITVNNSQSSPENNNNTNVKILNISDNQAIQSAKDAIKYYTGVDADNIIGRDALKPYITRNSSPYAWGPDILVSFSSDSNTTDNISASISAVDGKVYNVTAMVDIYYKTSIDENKVKAAAASFLKDKGLGDNFTSITVDYEKTSVGIVGAKALYTDGTEILMEFNADNNSVINFTHYNLKTMKFAN